MARESWQLKKNVNGRIYFPLTTARIRRWIEEDRVSEEDKVWRSGFTGWKEVGEVDEFKSYFEEEKPPEKIEEG